MLASRHKNLVLFGFKREVNSGLLGEKSQPSRQVLTLQSLLHYVFCFLKMTRIALQCRSIKPLWVSV